MFRLSATAATTMNNQLRHDEEAILRGIAADLASILKAGQPWGYGHAEEKWRYRDAKEGFVRPDAARWFGGPLDSAARMRLSRTLARMEKCGLIRRTSLGFGDGVRHTHIGLTPAGRKLAKELLNPKPADTAT